MDLNQIFIGGIPVAALVFILVEIAKEVFYVEGNKAKYLAGVLSVILVSIPLYVMPNYPAVIPFFEAVATLIVVFAGATAIYKVQK